MADQFTKQIIVNASVTEAYNAWANFENFPYFMRYIKSVRKTGDRTSHWVMDGPLGKEIEWDAQTTTMEPNDRLAWNSRDNGDITTSGQVVFKSLANDQTHITVTLQYVPPAGKLGEVVARIFSNPEAQLEEDLANFKEYIEGHRSRTAAA
ncbi:MAG TPA: SRPBCC family protein [Kouleothrix sp.]|uniref:SRPBCC family protein n=1 Tax=Kouleothrix sp. TaxID=2779161 RepID=UPI002C991B4D|nr:SRPBCC family protein [Kouleothrix sp.]HRC77053.1 SRPBCC family protein [Kouleothrix sp.]